jgi:hypothetical protein
MPEGNTTRLRRKLTEARLSAQRPRNTKSIQSFNSFANQQIEAIPLLVNNCEQLNALIGF